MDACDGAGVDVTSDAGIEKGIDVRVDGVFSDAAAAGVLNVAVDVAVGVDGTCDV